MVWISTISAAFRRSWVGAGCVRPFSNVLSAMRSARFAWTLLTSFLGVVLIFASVMKMEGIARYVENAESYARFPWWQFTIIEAELILGVWLIIGMNPVRKRTVSIVAFCAFAGASIYRLILGADSCGCFGIIKVNPWHSLSFDLAALGALILIDSKESTDPKELPSAGGEVVPCVVEIVGSSWMDFRRSSFVRQVVAV